ncbi:MAG: hypothetical protein HZR80_10000 [Candidatus Heimdallarchaeota archaeon]
MRTYNLDDKFRKNKQFQEYYMKLTKNNDPKERNKGYNLVAALRHYLGFRKVTIEKLINESLDYPEKEQKQMDMFVNSEAIKISRNSKGAHIRSIKRFLRDIGADFPRFNKKKKLFFSKDQVMIKHLENDVGQSWSNKKQVNRAIKHFIDFVSEKTKGQIKTPSDCINKIKDEYFSLEQLRDLLIEFYNWRRKQTNQSLGNDDEIDDVTAWKQMMMVKNFFEYRAFVNIKIPNNRKPMKMLHRTLPMGLDTTAKLVEVQTMRKLLKVADLRDSAALMIAFESGANPVDILQLQFKHFNYIEKGMKKSHLNVDDPDAIPKDKIVFIKLERSKTAREFYLALSGQSLQLISLLLRARMDGKFGFPDNITDESYIITQLATPYLPLKGKSLNHMFRKASELAGFDVDYLPSDFRNSFITRVKTFNHYGEIVKSILVGHSLGLGRNYEIVINSEDKLIGSPENVINLYDEYKQRWSVLFNLEYQSKEIAEQKMYFEHQMDMVHEQNKTLLKENQEMKSKINELIDDKEEFDDRFLQLFKELYFLKEKTNSDNFDRENEWKAMIDEKVRHRMEIDKKGGFGKLSKTELIDLLKKYLEH